MAVFEANGYVCSDDDQEIYDWFGIRAFSPGKLQSVIDALEDDEELTININSPGGTMFDGFEMYSRLKACKNHTVAVVQSLAASAASTVAIGCDEVRISPVAQIMIHRSAICTEGNEGQLRKDAKDLRSFDEGILNAYQLKCGEKSSRESLRSMMNAETWFPAQKAVEIGLADTILMDEDGVLAENVINLAGGAIRNAAGSSGLNLPQMRAEYHRMKVEKQKENDAGADARVLAAKQYRARNMF